MKTLRFRSFFLMLSVALVVYATGCIWTVFEHTYLATATSTVEVKGFAPQGAITPGQGICLMARNWTSNSYPNIYNQIATTTVSTSVQHKGPTPGGSNWYGYAFPAVSIPSWAWNGNVATVFVSSTCNTSGLSPFDFTGRVFVDQAQLDCFNARLDAGAPWNDNVCGPYHNMMYIHKP